jgi:secreted trypsin-like serine protease
MGVTSWGDECGKEETPGVYANLAIQEVTDWIRKTADYDHYVQSCSAQIR